MKRFERALKKDDLSDMPNITYFQKLKLAQKQQKEERLKELEQLHKNPKKLDEQQKQRLLDEDTDLVMAIEFRKKEIAQLTKDLMAIDKHLKKDLRISRYGKNELIDDIEDQENKKIYQELVNGQNLMLKNTQKNTNRSKI